MRIARRLARSITGQETFHHTDIRCPTLRLGSENAGFAVNPKLLGPTSVIYSFGIGTDISFDLELSKRFSADIYAFDPTPRSLAWIATQSVPPEIHVHPYGLAHFDGSLTFHAPENPSHVSYSMVDRKGECVTCPVYRLTTLMNKFGHDHLDLLKIDIEGCEYDVISDFLASHIPIRQFCVEFHHRLPGIGSRKTDLAIEALRAAGYRIFHISALGEEFSFIQT